MVLSVRQEHRPSAGSPKVTVAAVDELLEEIP
jgi:hypothetical protein